MLCIDTAVGEPVVAGLQTRCCGAAKPLSRGGFTEVGESEAGQLDVGAVTSADVSGVGAASPVDDADFPYPLTEGIPAYIDESGGEGIENEVFLVCYRLYWAALTDAKLVRAYMNTPPDPTFANKLQRRIIMDCIIERVLRIEEYRTSRHEFRSKVNELFAAYPEWGITRFRGASFVFHPLSRGMILCTGDVHPIITTVVITIVITIVISIVISIVITIAITIVITIVIVVSVVLVIVIVVFVVVAVVATAIGIILHSHHAQTPHVVAAPLPISK